MIADTSDRSIEDPAVIDRILAHLILIVALPAPPELLPAARAPPNSDWLVYARDFRSAFSSFSNPGMGCQAACCLMEVGGVETERKAVDSAQISVIAPIGRWCRQMIQANPATDILP